MNCQLTLNTRFVHEVCETLVSLSYQTVTFVLLKYGILPVSETCVSLSYLTVTFVSQKYDIL